MRKNLLISCGMALVVFLSVSCKEKKEISSPEQGVKEEKLEADKDFAFDFTLQNLNGESFTLSNYRNKNPVILFFWTTTCPFCRPELKNLNDLLPSLKKRGWEVFAIAVGEPQYRVHNFMQRNAYLLTILLDEDASVADGYRLLGVPTFVVINKEGRVVFKDNVLPLEKIEELSVPNSGVK
ncbi:MAG: TlpA family protein disulfide reductase [Candidatus Omnitrophica bacterium]|nr:TlpA family protein disulfide reductase [Candidatus Omnitrophota bacterium]